jgi:hypothetical protein
MHFFPFSFPPIPCPSFTRFAACPIGQGIGKEKGKKSQEHSTASLRNFQTTKKTVEYSPTTIRVHFKKKKSSSTERSTSTQGEE